MENARLAGEIRDLQTALKESEAARRDAENRAQRALAELQQLRVEMERRLQEKVQFFFLIPIIHSKFSLENLFLEFVELGRRNGSPT